MSMRFVLATAPAARLPPKRPAQGSTPCVAVPFRLRSRLTWSGAEDCVQDLFVGGIFVGFSLFALLFWLLAVVVDK